jgi:hypothetical protein
MSTWFRGHDAAELVKIRYNFGFVCLVIWNHCFRSFTGTADTYALDASYAVMGITLRLKQSARADMSACERARYIIPARAIQCTGGPGAAVRG